LQTEECADIGHRVKGKLQEQNNAEKETINEKDG
jgi:hypothetical protein